MSMFMLTEKNNMEKTKKCNCDLCKRNHKWNRFLKKYSESFTKDEKKFLDKIYEDLNMIEFDNEVNEAILDGSWPQAQDWLNRGLEKAKDIQKRRENGEKV